MVRTGPVKLNCAILAAAVVLAGCGGADKPSAGSQATPGVSGDQRGVLETVDALQTASRKGDGKTICSQIFTRALAASVEKAAKRSCPQEVRQRLFDPNAEISVGRDIHVKGSAATTVIREQNGHVSKLYLVKQGGRWRIDRVVPQKS